MSFFGSQWMVAKRKADEARERYTLKREAALAAAALSGLAHGKTLLAPPPPAAPPTLAVHAAPVLWVYALRNLGSLFLLTASAAFTSPKSINRTDMLRDKVTSARVGLCEHRARLCRTAARACRTLARRGGPREVCGPQGRRRPHLVPRARRLGAAARAYRLCTRGAARPVPRVRRRL